VTLTFTPDEYAVVEAALRRVQGRLRKRVRREALVVSMASQVLTSGDARTKSRHPVVVNMERGSERAYYDTDRGSVRTATCWSTAMTLRQTPASRRDAHGRSHAGHP